MKRVFVIFILFFFSNIALLGSEIAENRLKLSNQSWDISGGFLHYDKGAYDWVYVTRDLNFIGKLEGIGENDYFEWMTVHTKDNPTYTMIKFPKDKVLVGSVFTKVEEPLKSFASQFANQIHSVDGFFIRYGSDAFDWVYIDADNTFVAKLDGFDKTNNAFIWTMLDSALERGFETVELYNDSKVVYFGKAINLVDIEEDTCRALGGTWYEKIEECHEIGESSEKPNASSESYDEVKARYEDCIKSGGNWIDEIKFCDYANQFVSSSSSSSATSTTSMLQMPSSSSQSSSVNLNKSDEELCEESGGHWINEVSLCDSN